MLRLTYHERDCHEEDLPESYPFPRGGLRGAREAPLDGGACEAARQVERAMDGVQSRLDNLRLVLGFDDEPGDRPRAA